MREDHSWNIATAFWMRQTARQGKYIRGMARRITPCQRDETGEWKWSVLARRRWYTYSVVSLSQMINSNQKIDQTFNPHNNNLQQSKKMCTFELVKSLKCGHLVKRCYLECHAAKISGRRCEVWPAQKERPLTIKERGPMAVPDYCDHCKSDGFLAWF